MPFKQGQKVRGVKCGHFVVTKCERSHHGFTKFVVTVREFGPKGQLSRSTMRFPDTMLVAE